MPRSNANNASWSYAAAASGIAASTTAVTVKAAGASAVRHYVTSMQISHATLGNVTEFAIRDGAAGTVIYRMSLGTVATENIDMKFDPPLVGTAATLLEIITLSSATGGVYCNLQGFSQ